MLVTLIREEDRGLIMYEIFTRIKGYGSCKIRFDSLVSWQYGIKEKREINVFIKYNLKDFTRFKDSRNFKIQRSTYQSINLNVYENL